MQTADVAVVGLGAMGAATLYQLARRGVAVIGIDQFAPPHELGSSHGETRITRQAVGEGPDFAPFVMRSHQIWRDLEAATGATLLVQCGCLIIGNRNARAMYAKKPAFMERTLAVAEAFGIEHEILEGGSEIARRFPQFSNLADDDLAYFEPGGGFLHPEACISTQLAEAGRLGATVVTDTRVNSLTQRSGRVHVVHSGGEVQAKHIVVAAGAWNPKLLGAPFDGMLQVERQVLFWFAADAATYAPGVCPVFVRIFGSGDSDFFYGFPVPSGSAGVKVATEQHEVTTDADSVSREVTAAEAERFYATHIAGRLAGAGPELLRAKACLYTTNVGGSNFVMDWHPAMDRVFAISACSGHGFKHSAAIGEAVAELLTGGASSLALSPFRLR